MRKQLLIFGCVCLCLLLSSCQCAWAPDVGPVEGEDDDEAALYQKTAPQPLAQPLMPAQRLA